MRVIRLDGVVVAGPAGLDLDDPIARVGDGLIETMRARRGYVAHRGAHLDRLAGSIRVLCLAGAPSMAAIEAELDAALVALGALDARVRLVVGAGPTLWIDVATAGPLPDTPPTAAARAIAGGWVPGARIAEHKTTSRAHWQWAERVAADTGADVALLLDADGRLGESTRAAAFAVVDGVLRTAPVLGLLPGIGRRIVMEQSPETLEIACGREELLAADEVFLVSAFAGVTAVTSVDGRPVGTGAIGPRTAAIAGAYRERVRAETTPEAAAAPPVRA